MLRVRFRAFACSIIFFPRQRHFPTQFHAGCSEFLIVAKKTRIQGRVRLRANDWEGNDRKITAKKSNLFPKIWPLNNYGEFWSFWPSANAWIHSLVSNQIPCQAPKFRFSVWLTARLTGWMSCKYFLCQMDFSFNFRPFSFPDSAN